MSKPTEEDLMAAIRAVYAGGGTPSSMHLSEETAKRFGIDVDALPEDGTPMRVGDAWVQRVNAEDSEGEK